LDLFCAAIGWPERLWLRDDISLGVILMTKFRFLLLALVVLCGLCGVAKADSADFNARIQDPSGTYYEVDSSTFTVTFSDTACPTGFDGCFIATNNTGATITSLDLVFPDTPGLGGQPAGCTTSEGGSEFADAVCALTDGVYNLYFSGGTGIANTSAFDILEVGAPAAAFGDITATATLATPEPGSALLFATGTAFVGVVLGRRRGAGELPVA